MHFRSGADTLSRLSDVAQELGYNITSTVAGMFGCSGQTQLHVSCSPDVVEIRLLDDRGPAVSTSLSTGPGDAFALELAGEYLGHGGISRTVVIDDASGDPMIGFLNFTAETSASSEIAIAEFDLESGTWSSSGNITDVNDRFAPVLNASSIWKDAHVLMFALADMWSPDVVQHEAALDALLDLAVPTDPTRDKDENNAEKSCWTAGLTCTIAIFFNPAAGACAATASACLTMLGCMASDCEGDGTE